jgi:hypothetical protein
MNYTEPKPENHGFTCLHCNVLATHEPEKSSIGSKNTDLSGQPYGWVKKNQRLILKTADIECYYTICHNCKKTHIFIGNKVVYPEVLNYGNHETPCEEMPEEVKKLYDEATKVLTDSPRSSCMLLRYSLEVLLRGLIENSNPKKTRLVDYIEQFISENTWADKYKKHLHALRLIGNDAVHGTDSKNIDFFESIEDAQKDARFLFGFLNKVVEKAILEPKRERDFFEKHNLDERVPS